MKKSHFLIIAGGSVLLSILGFILDFNERIDDLFLNVFELCMMTILLFGLISMVYAGIFYLRKGFGFMK